MYAGFLHFLKYVTHRLWKWLVLMGSIKLLSSLKVHHYIISISSHMSRQILIFTQTGRGRRRKQGPSCQSRLIKWLSEWGETIAWRHSSFNYQTRCPEQYVAKSPPKSSIVYQKDRTSIQQWVRQEIGCIAMASGCNQSFLSETCLLPCLQKVSSAGTAFFLVEAAIATSKHLN